jgi:hypothetical protein
LLSSVYIFIRFINSFPKPWLDKTGYINKMGCTDGIGYIGYISCRVSKVKVRVLVVVYKVKFSVVLVLVLVLAKLFLKR